MLLKSLIVISYFIFLHFTLFVSFLKFILLFLFLLKCENILTWDAYIIIYQSSMEKREKKKTFNYEEKKQQYMDKSY